MNRLLLGLCCAAPLFTFVGCGGSAEEKPPEKAPEMTQAEKDNMEAQKAKTMEMYKNMGKKKK
jgi:hypothetical protein